LIIAFVWGQETAPDKCSHQHLLKLSKTNMNTETKEQIAFWVVVIFFTVGIFTGG
jgi:hypothetical protein